MEGGEGGFMGPFLLLVLSFPLRLHLGSVHENASFSPFSFLSLNA